MIGGLIDRQISRQTKQRNGSKNLLQYHSSEMRGLCLMKCLNETLTNITFSIFSSGTMFPLNKIGKNYFWVLTFLYKDVFDF